MSRTPKPSGRALKGIDLVCHLASEVGASQRACSHPSHTTTNALGTAVLIDALIEHPVEKLVVASTMSMYGEGAYQTADGTPVVPDERSVDQLRVGDWDVQE